MNYITAYFFQELFCKIEKWTKKNCPKSKNRKKFLSKKHKKTILLERCRCKSKIVVCKFTYIYF